MNIRRFQSVFAFWLTILFISSVQICVSTTGIQAQETPTTASEDQAILAGLAFVQNAGENWMEKRGCVSCHQVPSMIWSHEAARLAGITIDDAKLKTWKSWSTETRNFVKPAEKESFDPEQTLASNIDTMVALLLAIPEESEQPWAKTYLVKLQQQQQGDGSWKACGQLPMQKRSKQETDAVTTLWATYALTKFGQEFDEAKAMAFVDQIDQPESTEWLAVRVLVADQNNEPKDLQRFQSRLLKSQNQDGGWGFLIGQPSDALATGYALYALARVNGDRQAILRGRKYLLANQENNGSWKVPGTKTATQKRVTSTATDWGTAWAIVGLIESR